MSKNDRRVLIICLLICLFSLPLFFESIYVRVFSPSEASNDPSIGNIQNPRNDIRFKTRNSIGWTSLVNRSSDLRLGSSVFSGTNSGTRIELNNGVVLNMRENSLIKFSKINEFTLPDLRFGNFEMKAETDVQFVRDGEVVTIEKPTDGVVRISADEKGVRAFDSANRELTISTEKKTVLTASPPVPSPAPPAPVAPFALVPANQILEFDAKLTDLYERDPTTDGVYYPRSSGTLKRDVYFSWQTETPAMNQVVQHSASADMQNPVQLQTQSENQVFVRELFLGMNYWRLQSDDFVWSEPKNFEVILQELPLNSRLDFGQDDPILMIPPGRVPFQIRGARPEGLAGYLIEITREASELSSRQALLLAPEKNLELPVQETGTYSLRLREVMQDQRISRPSESVRLRVERPRLPDAPEIIGPSLRLGLGEQAPVQWRTREPVRRFEIEVTDLKNGTKQTFFERENRFDFKSATPGAFEVRVRSEDRFGQKSSWSGGHEVGVMAPLAPPPAPLQPGQGQNAVAELETNQQRGSIPLERPRRIFSNQMYDSDNYSVEVAGYAATSSEQKLMERTEALGSLIGFRFRKNTFDRQAAEGVVRSKVIGFNDSTHSSIFMGDLRYFYRFDTELLQRWFGLKPFISAGVGAEIYRAQGVGLYSPAYDIFKTGVRINFPIWRRWLMGGDIFYGYATDSSLKVEVAGHFGYFFDQRFSAGAGYRVYFFDAATAKSTPQGMPYREAFGEGYTVFRYHF